MPAPERREAGDECSIREGVVLARRLLSFKTFNQPISESVNKSIN